MLSQLMTSQPLDGARPCILLATFQGSGYLHCAELVEMVRSGLQVHVGSPI